METAVLNLGEVTGVNARLEGRARVARARAQAAQASLADCQLCARHCGVDRLAGELGLCQAAAQPRLFRAQMESADELELIPTFAIALSGCNLRCDFCITGAQSWHPTAGAPIPPGALAARACAALAAGARTITFLGGEPTIHLPFLLQVIAHLPSTAKLVWKTNGYGAFAARALLYGLFDVWCADYKFGNDACAERLAQAADYNHTVRDNLLWASQQSELIVRHLLMPGHAECCWAPVAKWLARRLPSVKVNLRAGFWPGWRAHRHPELRTAPTAPEIQRAWGIAREWGLNLIE
jgi:putative pyruvate formate lyase activating enzyme